ncbi:intradiol ring-cleavage dioxygenase [Cupriavidus taiwanensis]|uniref:intradiol ring-cleavage dioxygenase n=1 Tax=Cupriavidus taiwanensis TaxID=164546 RepID=UPI000E108A99|nr:intradiol ring-cleavage dioxygenase [Cupriavidus taiwanensis]SPA30245.1 Hydroxyquinol 1,2-dioxygenase [Cupriavidus taiwanensis]SPA55953.1 Hydroxyquinol 1,2-dioxygenase [Cupriavidus taiwanensis]
MRNLNEETITQAVLARNIDMKDRRLREIMTSLIQHLHAFARETRLTEAEWAAGIRFLTEVGQTCSPTRQEFILLSDTLGLSTLVTAQNHRKPQGCTEATVFGPFYVDDAPEYELGADVGNGMAGQPCFVSGQVRGISGEAIPGAKLEVWQADSEGFYDVQLAQGHVQGRGTLVADATGHFHFKSIVAESYPIPHDGPVGRMLDAMGRHPWRPAHLHFMVSAPGYETLVTHVFREGGEYLDSDAVFGVRSSLIADWVEHAAGTTPDGDQSATPFYTLDFDFVLNPATDQTRRKP